MLASEHIKADRVQRHAAAETLARRARTGMDLEALYIDSTDTFKQWEARSVSKRLLCSPLQFIPDRRSPPFRASGRPSWYRHGIAASSKGRASMIIINLARIANQGWSTFGGNSSWRQGTIRIPSTRSPAPCGRTQCRPGTSARCIGTNFTTLCASGIVRFGVSCRLSRPRDCVSLHFVVDHGPSL